MKEKGLGMIIDLIRFTCTNGIYQPLKLGSSYAVEK